MHWYTDDDLSQRALDVGMALTRLATRTEVFPLDEIGALAEQLPDLATKCMTLDPAKLISELERVQEATKTLDPLEGRDVATALREAERPLDDWEGSAAEAFRQRLRDLGAFIGDQHERTTAYAKALASLTALAIYVREDYCKIADETIKLAKDAEREAASEGIDFLLKVCAATAKAAFTGFNPADVAGAVTDIAVETAIYMRGGSFDAVLESHRKEVDELVKRLYESFGQVLTQLREAMPADDRTRHHLELPMPPTTQVDSPDFRYEHFSAPSRPVEDFEGPVAEERKRMTEGSRPNSVARRLETE